MADATGPDHAYTGLEVAVIGMAGRFPAAASVDDLWANLLDGVEGISRLGDDELREMGVSPRALAEETYVRAKGVFPGIEFFDSGFFDYTPADAAVLDPQVRALHEEVYHALEDAGYSADGRREAIGLFLGATNNMPWEVDTQRRFNEDAGSAFSGMQLNDKDFAATRIAHSLGLKGPALTLHSACSSSLVAIDAACRNVWTGSCQVALAGGSGLTLPHKNGYRYRPNMVHSPDGHCRAFDAAAEGTVEGNGAGVVALKPLEAALRDGDRIYAVIKGSAVNNDGTRKVGYTAPSIEGQAEVIRKAHRVAGVRPADISYVEAHGTGTALGDPVEIEALAKAFGPGEPDSCGVGSLKASIGHLDTAAGVASFIKACKTLEERTIPQSLHFETPNPGIRLDGTPFYIAGKQREMRRKRSASGGEIPLRAGVSAFGIGGTNAHLVLEEAPPPDLPAPDGRAHNTFVLSAASAEAIARMKRDFADHLAAHPNTDGADLAWTLQSRQRDLPYRYAVGFRDAGQLRERLEESLEAGDEPAHLPRNGRRDVHLLFSGAGSQHLRMGRGLYETEGAFRARVDECLAVTDAFDEPVVREVFFGETVAQEKQLNNIAVSPVLLFIVDYAMARTLLDWGVRPRGMIGHSTGELAAACVAGVFSLEDGIRLMLARGALIASTPEGAVTSVKASEDTIRPMLTEELSIAAVNAPEDCTVSGTAAAVAAFERKCTEQGITFTHVEAEHAYHSQYMEPILDRYREIAESVAFSPPEIPYVSNVTGTWVTPEQATDPGYYCEHIRRTVLFKAGVETVMERGDVLFVEVGPGKSLSSFVRGTARGTRTTAINMLRHPLEEVADGEHLATAVKKLWEAGVALDWTAFHRGRAPRKVRTPLYAFDRTEYPVDITEFQRLMSAEEGRPRPVAARRPAASGPAAAPPQALQPTWSRALLPDSGGSGRGRALLVFSDDPPRIRRTMDEVAYWTPIPVGFGGEYRFDGPSGAQIRRGSEGDLRRLVADLEEHALVGDTVVVHHRPGAAASALIRQLCAAVSGMRGAPVRDLVVLEPAAGDDPGARARLLPEVIGLNREYPRLRVRLLGCDTPLAARQGPRDWSRALRRELEAEVDDALAVRYRDGGRYVPAMVPLPGRRGPAAPGGRTAVVCPADAVGDVLAAAGPDRAVDVLPFAPGAEADGPTPAGEHRQGRAAVGAPVRGRTGEDVVTGLLSRLRGLTGTDRLVLWDTSLQDAAADDADADGPEPPAPRTLLRGLRDAGSELGVPFGVVSRLDLDRFAWNADITAAFAANTEADAESGDVRLYAFGPLDADPPVLDLLHGMGESGVRTGHHGTDLLEAVAAGKEVGASEESGVVDKRSAVAAVIEREMAGLLGVDGIDVRADLFDVGLDSLKLIQFTSALERHGYTVLASDVHSHPTVAELAGLLARSGKQVNQECDSLESAAALLGERLDTRCALHGITAGADEEEWVVLFVDGLREEDRTSVVRRINELRLPQAFTPHYILPGSAEERFLAGRDFATLELGADPTSQGGGADRLFAEIDRRQEDMRRSILSRPVRWSYPISGTQKHYFSRGARPQLYLVQFRELIDADMLERALGDVVGRHGLMRSVLVRSLGQWRWKEHEPPTAFVLPRIDLSPLPLPRQEEVRAELVKREWNVDLKTDTIMYQAVLVKYNERSYDLVCQFDHSIFDGASGQAFRSDLLKRYQELAEGTAKALPRARNFRHLKEQTGKGPVGIGADEIIEKFDLDAWGRYGKEIIAASKRRGTGRMCDVRYTVDLRSLQSGDDQEVDPFSLVLYLYARLVARLLGVDKVALDLVFNSRVYEDVDYSGVMGMVADVLPVVVSGEQGVRDDLEVLIQQKLQMMNRYNVNFSDLVTGPLTALKYGKVLQTTKAARGAGFRPSCMVNFAGNTEAEYDAIWDMTLELLTENQETLDYADCYCVSKVSGSRQDIVILTTWVEDSAEVVSILDEEVAYLARQAAGTGGADSEGAAPENAAPDANADANADMKIDSESLR
ncbi:acyl transferase domain-containing protein/aryl carrier-like protein [Nocardiopsis mwathae]|uniref:Acyl transferase domain-containing protein/aryl carrier-like protein n=1 Tax=Nocardiopsis mwathae TaxID=1472723 RepID=A0A7W9YE42_9ACTN|nr:type I polyketide synthase [Nocardiopsis mwathae]MBB6170498.1 acyl transferase domain-containing protein/aryl carrier-like protein [Nocardiopsis mwathae]